MVKIKLPLGRRHSSHTQLLRGLLLTKWIRLSSRMCRKVQVRFRIGGVSWKQLPRPYQLHLMVPTKGGSRRKYGGTVTRHNIRKGDYVEAVKAGIKYKGWCSGDTAKQVSVSNAVWKRIGQFTASKVKLLRRATGLICTQEEKFLVAV